LKQTKNTFLFNKLNNNYSVFLLTIQAWAVCPAPWCCHNWSR